MTKRLADEIQARVDTMWDDPSWREDNPSVTLDDCKRYALVEIVDAGPNCHEYWPAGRLPNADERVERETWRKVYREAKRIIENA